MRELWGDDLDSGPVSAVALPTEPGIQPDPVRINVDPPVRHVDLARGTGSRHN